MGLKDLIASFIQLRTKKRFSLKSEKNTKRILPSYAKMGFISAATNTGYQSAATSEGKHSVAIATGYKSKARAIKGSAIVVCERNDDGDLIGIKSAIIDGEILKENTFYTLEDGEFKEVE